MKFLLRYAKGERSSLRRTMGKAEAIATAPVPTDDISVSSNGTVWRLYRNPDGTTYRAPDPASAPAASGPTLADVMARLDLIEKRIAALEAAKKP